MSYSLLRHCFRCLLRHSGSYLRVIIPIGSVGIDEQGVEHMLD